MGAFLGIRLKLYEYSIRISTIHQFHEIFITCKEIFTLQSDKNATADNAWLFLGAEARSL